MNAIATLLLALASPQEAPPAWVEAEAGLLEHHVQLTSEAFFRKAGECYFSPDGRQIVFQAIERKDDPAAEEAFYQMYVADLVFGADERVAGIDNLVRLSPEGSSNTCGWFHPTEPGVVIFGSTVVPPVNPDRTGYQRESSRYSWQFPKEMDIVRFELARADGTTPPAPDSMERLLADGEAYLAECVVRNDGRYMVYCEHKVAEGSSGGDLFVVDLTTGSRVKVTGQQGYDGGPFFSPEGERLTYRSDRRGDDLLQIFVSELEFDERGKLTGVAREFQLTDNAHVNWAPYWHPSGRYLVYTTSQMGHDNYEVFLIDADRGESGPTKYGSRRRRVTHAARFDGLPVFDRSGRRMMWTSQRGADGSSQVWIADFVMPLDPGDAAATEAAAAEGDGESNRLQVLDPDTGLYFVYDTSSHKLQVYDPKTHKARPAEGDEVARAMTLFNAQGE